MKTLVRAALQTFLSSMLVQVLTAVAGIYLARQLGPVGRGELAAALLWPPVFFAVIQLGYGQGIQFLFAQVTERERQSMFGNSLLLSLATGVPVAAAAWFLLPYLLRSQPEYVTTLARIYMLHVPMGLVAESASNILLASRRFAQMNVLRVLNPAIHVGGLVALTLFDQVAVTPVFAVQVLSGHASFIYGLWQLRRAGYLTLQPDLTLLKRCLRFGVRTHLGTLCSLTSGQGDRMLMAAFLPSRALGLYSVAVNTSMLPYPLVQAITTTLMPAVAQESEQERRLTSLRVARLTPALLLLVYAGLFVVAGPLVKLLYGAAFAEAIAAARVLMLGTVAFGSADVLRQAMRALGRPALASMGDVAGLVATLILLALLLPRFGFMGAAYASLGAYLITYLVLLVCSVKLAGVRLRELILPNRTDVQALWAAARGAQQKGCAG